MLYVKRRKQLCHFMDYSVSHYMKTEELALILFLLVLSHFRLSRSCARVSASGYILVYSRKMCVDAEVMINYGLYTSINTLYKYWPSKRGQLSILNRG